MFTKLLRHLARRWRPASIQDLTRTSPISANFGWDRGTPVDRYHIERFLRGQAPVIRGKVLEVGDSTYTRKFSNGRAASIDVLHFTAGHPEATIVGDLTDPATLPVDAFDCFICPQTLQYTYEIQKAVEGAHRLLRPGGTLLATVPGISQISRQDAAAYGEYWRFTTHSMERLFGSVFRGGLDVGSQGNVLSATALLQGIAVEDLPDASLLDRNDPEYQVIVTVAAKKEGG
jgi:SAM-dependent methyltransferase